jgi:PD-(D/E)XK nuclease superfamily protein
MDVVYEYSVFQIDNYERCPRKWGWLQLDGVVRGPKSKYQLFGIDGHGILEKWFKKRHFEWDRDASKAAAELAKLLPTPQEVDPANVEQPFGVTLAGFRFIGDMDLFMPKGPNGKPRIYDYKFPTSLDWMLTPEAMVDDVQVTLYAAYGLLKTNAPEIEVQWNYSRRTGSPKALPVLNTLNGAAIRPRIEKTLESAREMKEIQEAGLTSLDLPFNPCECEAYGGCEFKSLCNLTAEQQMEAVMEQASAKGSFLKKLQERRNGQPVEQPVNPEPPAAVAAPAPTPAPTNPLAAKLAARNAAAAQAQVQSAPPLPEATPEPVATPARGPGRPKKDNTSEVWSSFAQAALPAAIGYCLKEGVLGTDEAAQTAAEYADAMVLEYSKRF